MKANFSKKIEEANKAIGAARRVLAVVMRGVYPLGSTVRVVHARGSFIAKVRGYDTLGARIGIENMQSGKGSFRRYCEIEHVDRRQS